MVPMLLLALACKPEEAPEVAEDVPCDGVDDPDQSHMVMLQQIYFSRRDEQNRAWGFNLDGLDSNVNDAGGCFKPDQISPDGRTGVDSSFSALVPILEQTEGAAVEGLIQQSINNGALLISLELDDLDDYRDDACVRAKVGRAKGPPMLATDGFIESGQTYERDTAYETAVMDGLAVTDGTVEGGPFAWTLQVQVLDAEVNLSFTDAFFHYEFNPDGTGWGYLGGGLDIAYLIDFMSGIQSDVDDVLVGAVQATADLRPGADGECTELSAVLEFETASGFYFE